MSPMADHDPLCPYRSPRVSNPWAAHGEPCGGCALIAEVRADEQAKFECRMPCCDEGVLYP